MRIIFIIFILILTTKNLYARDYIRIVGSSTLYPFITNVAEEFSKLYKYKAPIIEVNGTGGGFNLFCKGISDKYPDIVNASRPIKQSEIELCSKHKVNNIKEYKIGFDGIIIANSIRSVAINLTSQELFLALAKKVPKDGQLVKNFYNKWSDINPQLPNWKIEFYGPSPTSGTRDAFVDIIMERSCHIFPEYRKSPNLCSMIRHDGRYIEVGENDNIVIQKLEYNNRALGIIGYNYLIQNNKIIKPVSVNNSKPDFTTIAKGKYLLSRPLYIYKKQESLQRNYGAKEFINHLLDIDTIGPKGYLIGKGFIPNF